MQIHRLRSADQYVERLQKDKEEVAALFKELLIGVTQFFRDPAAWQTLKKEVLPGLLTVVMPLVEKPRTGRVPIVLFDRRSKS